MLILGYLLLSKQEYIKHYSSGLYMCDLVESEIPARKPRSCNIESATNWNIAFDGTSVLIKAVKSDDVLDTTPNHSIVLTDYDDSHQQGFVIEEEDENRVRLKRGDRCIQYNLSSNDYDFLECSENEHQYFSLIYRIKGSIDVEHSGDISMRNKERDRQSLFQHHHGGHIIRGKHTSGHHNEHSHRDDRHHDNWGLGHDGDHDRHHHGSHSKHALDGFVARKGHHESFGPKISSLLGEEEGHHHHHALDSHIHGEEYGHHHENHDEVAHNDFDDYPNKSNEFDSFGHGNMRFGLYRGHQSRHDRIHHSVMNSEPSHKNFQYVTQ